MEINTNQKWNKLIQKEIIISCASGYNQITNFTKETLILKLGLIVNATWSSSNPQVKFYTYKNPDYSQLCPNTEILNSLSKSYSYSGSGDSLSWSTIDLFPKFYSGYTHIYLVNTPCDLKLYSDITKSESNIFKIFLEYREL